MKNWGLFLGGVVTGIALTFLFAVIFNQCSNEGTPKIGVKDFEKPGKVINEKSVKVLQVISDNAALVNGQDDDFPELYSGAVYLIRNNDGEYYYDEQIINLPKGKNFRQTGIYEYNTRSGYKTVAIIEIM